MIRLFANCDKAIQSNQLRTFYSMQHYRCIKVYDIVTVPKYLLLLRRIESKLLIFRYVVFKLPWLCGCISDISFLAICVCGKGKNIQKVFISLIYKSLSAFPNNMKTRTTIANVNLDRYRIVINAIVMLPWQKLCFHWNEHNCISWIYLLLRNCSITYNCFSRHGLLSYSLMDTYYKPYNVWTKKNE